MSHTTPLTSALKSLARLPVGAEAWCWMHRDSDDTAVMVVRPCAKDPQGEAFAKRVLKVRAGRSGQSTQGVIRRLPSGSLSFVVRRSPDTAVAIHAALCRTAAVGEMPDLTIIHTRSGKLLQTRQAVNLSAQRAFLAALSAGQKGEFYLMTGEQLSAPRLLLSASRDDLKAQATAEKQRIRRTGAAARGQLRRSRSGDIELRTSGDADQVIADLSAWATRHDAHWPTFTALRTARAA